MTIPTKSRRQFTAQQKQEAVELFLTESLSCHLKCQITEIPFGLWQTPIQTGFSTQRNSAVTLARFL